MDCGGGRRRTAEWGGFWIRRRPKAWGEVGDVTALASLYAGAISPAQYPLSWAIQVRTKEKGKRRGFQEWKGNCLLGLGFRESLRRGVERLLRCWTHGTLKRSHDLLGGIAREHSDTRNVAATSSIGTLPGFWVGLRERNSRTL